MVANAGAKAVVTPLSGDRRTGRTEARAADRRGQRRPRRAPDRRREGNREVDRCSGTRGSPPRAAGRRRLSVRLFARRPRDLQCDECRERDSDDLPVETRPVPLVTLPLGATRDRVVGTLSVEDALAGEADFDPGLLARANRGILYVDEVNLLDDHLVDVILDSAANGANTVERDGISISHPPASPSSAR